MDEVVWTLIGLLAASVFGNMYWLGAKIDRLGARLDGRIDTCLSLIAAQTARIDAQTARIDTQTARIDVLSGRLDELSARFGAHEAHHGT